MIESLFTWISWFEVSSFRKSHYSWRVSLFLRSEKSSSRSSLFMKRTFVFLLIQDLHRTFILSFSLRSLIIWLYTLRSSVRRESRKYIISLLTCLNWERSSDRLKTIIWEIRSYWPHESSLTVLYWRLIQIDQIFHLSAQRLSSSLSPRLNLSDLILRFIKRKVSSSDQVQSEVLWKVSHVFFVVIKQLASFKKSFLRLC